MRPVPVVLLLLAAAASAAFAASPQWQQLAETAPVSHLTTGVATAQRSLGLSGQGVSVAIVDGGVNYKHVGFGHCDKLGGGASCRVKRGYDFAGDVLSEEDESYYDEDYSDDGDASTRSMGSKGGPDKDPVECGKEDDVHGTSVAWVAAGDDTSRPGQPRRGVAYRSWINAYKVIRGNCNKTDEQASDGAALPAIRAAARDGSDVINLSFGSSFGQSPFVSREYYAAMNTAMRNGSMVVLAGGNDGLIGPWVTDGQLSVSGVISVASAAAKLELPAPLLELSQALRLQNSKPAQASLRSASILVDAPAFVNGTQALLAKGAALPAQPLKACVPVLHNKQQVRGKVVLVQRGDCRFSAKAQAAAAAGAAAVIIFNNDTQPTLANYITLVEVPAIPVAAVERAAGEALLQAAKSARGLRVTLKPGGSSARLVAEPAWSSSWGPTAALEMVPVLTAHGDDVMVATDGTNGYGSKSGSSFAAPLVTGALALYKESRPTMAKPGKHIVNPRQSWDQAVAAAARQALAGPAAQPTGGFTNQAAAYAAFVSTARPIEWRERKGWAQPVSRVGAGLIQVDAAIQNPTTLVPNHLLLRSNRPSQTVTLTAVNAARYPVTYKLSHMPAAAVALGSYTWFELDPTSLLRPLAAGVTLKVAGKAATHLTLPPGGRADIQVVLALPRTLSAGPYLYSGYVRLVPTTTAADKAPGPGASVPLAPVPLVVPYQGYSQNFTTAPMLPQPQWKAYPLESSLLACSLRLCYIDELQELDARLAEAYEDDESTVPEYRPNTTYACWASAPSAATITRLPLNELMSGSASLGVIAPLLRPALHLSLMLFEAKPGCNSSKVGGCAKGALVGRLWRYDAATRAAPLQMDIAKAGVDALGRVSVLGPDGEAVGKRALRPSKQKQYKMQLWVTGVLAAADRAAGERYHTFKYDIPGTFTFV